MRYTYTTPYWNRRFYHLNLLLSVSCICHVILLSLKKTMHETRIILIYTHKIQLASWLFMDFFTVGLYFMEDFNRARWPLFPLPLSATARLYKRIYFNWFRLNLIAAPFSRVVTYIGNRERLAFDAIGKLLIGRKKKVSFIYLWKFFSLYPKKKERKWIITTSHESRIPLGEAL